MKKIIEELKMADDTLDADGYKSWGYVRLAIAQAMDALSQDSGKPLVSSSGKSPHCCCDTDLVCALHPPFEYGS